MADSVTVTLPDSVSLTVTASEATSLAVTAPASSSLSVTNKGPKGDKGDTGATGATGAAGSDGADGQGVPTGGVADQIIVKQSATDYDTAWDYIQTITEAVKNVSGGPLDKGTPVHVTGSTGNTVEVIAADAATNYPAHLILNEDLADEAEGRGVALGFINNVDVPDASIYSEGQTVYLGASGGWTTTKPTGTNAIQNLGVIVKVNTSGNKISGVVLGAGRANDVPNLPSGKFFIGSATYTSESAYTLPTSDGTTGQLLQTDGAGAVTFVDFSGSPWTTSGSDIYYTTGNVGVGTTTPAKVFHAAGDSQIDGTLLVKTQYNAVILGSATAGGANSAQADGNVIVGHNAMGSYTYGNGNSYRNVAIGISALNSGTGPYNVAVGRNSMRLNQTRSAAVGIGNASFENGGGTHGVGVGLSAGRYATGDYNTLIGGNAGVGVSGSSTFSNTVAVGYQALTALTTGAGNTAVGYQAGAALTTGGSNTLFGYQAGNNIVGQANTVVIGKSPMATNPSSNSVFIGSGVRSNSTVGQAVAIGQDAEAGFSNVAVGKSAEANGAYTVSLGWYANQGGSAANSVFIGYNTGRFVSGTNTVVGGRSMYSTNGTGNTILGTGAFDGGGSNNDNNTILGSNAGHSGSGNVLIGYDAGSTGSLTNKLYIENSNSATPLIYGEFDNDIVRVNGSFEVTGGVTADDGGLTAAGDYGKSAEVWYQGTGATQAGSVCYLNSSGNWTKTNATSTTNATGMLAVAAGSDSDVDGMVTRGFVYVSSDPGGSVGDIVYLSAATDGLLTTTAPTGTTGFVVRVVGHKVGTNIIYFNPSNDWIELA